MKTPFLFIGRKISAVTHQWLYDQEIQYVEANTDTPVEKFDNQTFDAFLFFNTRGVENFKASGNFPHPSSIILVNENSTAQAAWGTFTNKVIILPEQEELSFVQYAVARWMKEISK
jgi:hypothetical protein